MSSCSKSEDTILIKDGSVPGLKQNAESPSTWLGKSPLKRSVYSMEFWVSRICLLSHKIYTLETWEHKYTGVIQNECSRLSVPQPSQRDYVWKYTTEIQAHHANKYLIKHVCLHHYSSLSGKYCSGHVHSAQETRQAKYKVCKGNSGHKRTPLVPYYYYLVLSSKYLLIPVIRLYIL